MHNHTKQALDQAVIEAKGVCLTELETLLERAAEVEDELAYASLREDELAAHVERLLFAVRYCAEYLNAEKLNSIGSGSKAHQELNSALASTPDISSFARHDLIKQAEVLEYMGEEVKNMHPKANKDGIAEHLTHVSRRYRQQAKDL